MQHTTKANQGYPSIEIVDRAVRDFGMTHGDEVYVTMPFSDDESVFIRTKPIEDDAVWGVTHTYTEIADDGTATDHVVQYDLVEGDVLRSDLADIRGRGAKKLGGLGLAQLVGLVQEADDVLASRAEQ